MSSETPSVIRGSCQCKGIQYEVTSGTAQWILCHCNTCRKSIGADHYTAIAVKESALTLKAQDTLKTYRSSKEVERSFCSNCGCSIFMKADMEKNTKWIAASTLDDEIPVTRPTQICLENKPYWLDTLISAPGSDDIANWEVDCAKDL